MLVDQKLKLTASHFFFLSVTLWLSTRNSFVARKSSLFQTLPSRLEKIILCSNQTIIFIRLTRKLYTSPYLCHSFILKMGPWTTNYYSFVPLNKKTTSLTLKEQCHKDFAVLGQFCTKSLLWGFNHKQNVSVKLWRRYQMNFIREG